MTEGDREPNEQSGPPDVLKHLAPFDFVPFATHRTRVVTHSTGFREWNVTDFSDDAAEAISDFENIRIALRICF